MKIYINARFLTQPITGVQRFATELSLRLKELDPSIVFVCPHNVIQHETFDKLEAKIIGKRTGHLWEQIDLPLFLKTNGSPLLVNLCNTAPAFYKNKIATLHDVIYIRYSQSCSLKFRLLYFLLIPKILKSSLTLITVSEFSKQEISSYFKYPFENIHVIYNAINEQFKINKTRNKNAIPYLLAVSSINYHKNYSRTIEAFSNLCKSKNLNISLLVIGGSSSCFTKQSYIISQNVPIRFLGRVNDNELVKLYQSAKAFVFPSLYEGFGIPPLEAQSCGCPVIASKTTSMPEILGDSVIYFNPTDISEIQNTMDTIIANQQLRDSLTTKGLSNVSRFSWEDSACKLYNVILRFSLKENLI
jgi:glycosyltransferase involved in cell wall biosynthesis